MTAIECSVIIPHHEGLADLDRCLAALERQTLPSDRFEIIVADNDSPCGRDAVEKAIAGRARLVTVVERGAGPARNGGAASARAPVLAFTDADCVPEARWLEAGLNALRPGLVVGGQVTVLVEDGTGMTPTEAFEAVFAFNFESYIRDKGFTGSGNLFVHRADFERVGGFRVGVSEDVEWSHRATASGLRLIYAPDAIVGHPARRDWNELVRKWRRLVSEQHLLIREKPLGELRWLLKSWALPFSAVAHLHRPLLSPKLPRFSDRLGAIAILVRQRMWRFVEHHRILFARRGDRLKDRATRTG